MEIVGKKIILTPLKKEDTELIVKWRNNENVRKNFIFQETFTEEIHLNWFNSKVSTGEVVQFIIKEKNSLNPIGSVYFRDVNNNEKTAEYGIFIGEDSARGNGYGTEAAQLALQYAFKELNLNNIILRVFADNIAAIKSYEKVGFKYKTEKILLMSGNYRKIIFMVINKYEFLNFFDDVDI